MLIVLSKVQGYNSLMIKPKLDYEYLAWSLNFRLKVRLSDGKKVFFELISDLEDILDDNES